MVGAGILFGERIMYNLLIFSYLRLIGCLLTNNDEFCHFLTLILIIKYQVIFYAKIIEI